jgi:nucleotide-binding universal stress UspA family protein
MAKRILVAVDRTTNPDELLALVSDVARGSGATVRLLQVAPMPDSIVTDGRTLAYSDQEEGRVRAEALDALRTCELHVTADDVDSVVRFGDPAQEILREADEFGADLIAMPATCRPSVRRMLFGSVAAKVARRAPMAVLLMRPAA